MEGNWAFWGKMGVASNYSLGQSLGCGDNVLWDRNMGIRAGCKPRADVLQGELSDAIFAAN
jgi:hypothetical protein